MVKGIAKYGFKSGVLPKPRFALQPLKTSWELEKEKKLTVGFKDPRMAPKRPRRAMKQRKEPPTAQEIIANSAKEPKRVIEPVNEYQKWKLLGSSIRRKYLKDALLTEQQHHQDVLERRERQFEEARQHRLNIQKMEDSVATKLTLPTIESFLTQGPFVQPRTAEQKEELKLKRQYNQKRQQLKVEQKISSDLLEIYQNSSSYIINEEQLESTITRLFAGVRSERDGFDLSTPTGQAKNLMALLYNHNDDSADIKDAQRALTQELLGTTSNGQPGLPEVEEALGANEEKKVEL
jgi:hypothetical protein